MAAVATAAACPAALASKPCVVPPIVRPSRVRSSAAPEGAFPRTTENSATRSSRGRRIDSAGYALSSSVAGLPNAELPNTVSPVSGTTTISRQPCWPAWFVSSNRKRAIEPSASSESPSNSNSRRSRLKPRSPADIDTDWETGPGRHGCRFCAGRDRLKTWMRPVSRRRSARRLSANRCS